MSEQESTFSLDKQSCRNFQQLLGSSNEVNYGALHQNLRAFIVRLWTAHSAGLVEFKLLIDLLGEERVCNTIVLDGLLLLLSQVRRKSFQESLIRLVRALSLQRRIELTTTFEDRPTPGTYDAMSNITRISVDSTAAVLELLESSAFNQKTVSNEILALEYLWDNIDIAQLMLHAMKSNRLNTVGGCPQLLRKLHEGVDLIFYGKLKLVGFQKPLASVMPSLEFSEEKTASAASTLLGALIPYGMLPGKVNDLPSISFLIVSERSDSSSSDDKETLYPATVLKTKLWTSTASLPISKALVACEVAHHLQCCHQAQPQWKSFFSSTMKTPVETKTLFVLLSFVASLGNVNLFKELWSFLMFCTTGHISSLIMETVYGSLTEIEIEEVPVSVVSQSAGNQTPQQMDTVLFSFVASPLAAALLANDAEIFEYLARLTKLSPSRKEFTVFGEAVKRFLQHNFPAEQNEMGAATQKLYTEIGTKIVDLQDSSMPNEL